MRTTTSDPSDLTDAQWALVEPLLPAATGRGRPVALDRRAVLTAIVSVLRTGCHGRALPADGPNHTTVDWSVARWIAAGVCAQINDVVRQHVRVTPGRDANPSAASSDRQSVQTTEQGGSRR